MTFDLEGQFVDIVDLKTLLITRSPAVCLCRKLRHYGQPISAFQDVATMR
jgi:hypothetical protein